MKWKCVKSFSRRRKRKQKKEQKSLEEFQRTKMKILKKIPPA